MSAVGEPIKRKHKQRGQNKKIKFSEEKVTKDSAKELLSNYAENPSADFSTKISDTLTTTDEINTIQNKRKHSQEHSDSQNHDKKTKKLKKRDRWNRKTPEDNSSSQPKIAGDEENLENKLQDEEEDVPKPLSMRTKKKNKHKKSMEDTKINVHKSVHQEHMSYLSKWKNDKTNWKFEKLKQIWLLQNLYDSSKIDDEYWDIVVEYFSNSKGKVRTSILKEAIQTIESEKELNGCEENIKLKRSRDIVMNLQE